MPVTSLPDEGTRPPRRRRGTRAWGYAALMRHMPTILLLLSFPAGILGYALAVRVMQALPLGDDTRGFLVLFVPLFVAGLFMLPFLIPFFDRKARQDLAEYARAREAAADPPGERPEAEGD
jgi:hypothetical protein